MTSLDLAVTQEDAKLGIPAYRIVVDPRVGLHPRLLAFAASRLVWALPSIERRGEGKRELVFGLIPFSLSFPFQDKQRGREG